MFLRVQKYAFFITHAILLLNIQYLCSDLKHLIMEKKHWELRKLLEAVEKELSWKPLKPIALQRVRGYLHGIEKPKRETLDRISLFVGFQDWDSFKKALHGENSGQSNYEGGDEEERKEAGK